MDHGMFPHHQHSFPQRYCWRHPYEILAQTIVQRIPPLHSNPPLKPPLQKDAVFGQHPPHQIYHPLGSPHARGRVNPHCPPKKKSMAH